ncbi:Ribosomal protein L1p/L10e family [Lotmaria passim]
MSFLVKTEEAVRTLVDFLAADAGKSAPSDDVNELFAPASENKCVPVDLQLAFLVAPAAHRVPLYFTVPHETVSGSLCLITPAPQRKFKDKVFALSEDGDAVAKRVRRVIDSQKLAAKVVGPVAVRAFAKSYDHFIVYGLHKYPPQLTGEFLEHRRIPVWVSHKGSFAEKLHTAVRTVVVPRRGDNAVTCRIGHTGLSVQEIVENITSFVDQFVQCAEGAPLKNILHIRVCCTGSQSKQVGLPIFGHTFDFSNVEKSKKTPAKRQKVEA